MANTDTDQTSTSETTEEVKQEPPKTTPPAEQLQQKQSSKRKRRADESSGGQKSRAKRNASNGETSITQDLHPVNTEGSKYILAEVDPHTVGVDGAQVQHRYARLDKVSFSLMDRAPQIKVSEDCTEVTGEKGYSMARSTHGTHCGSWYYEIEILEPEQMLPKYPSAAWRIGWAQEHANLQGPVGLDVFSYSWRSVKGDKFSHARSEPYGEAYGPGDVLGFYINLADGTQPSLLRPKKEFLVQYKGRNYYEQVGVDKVDMSTVRPLVGSKIIAYKNGVCQGVMFENITNGKYFPAASLYMGARVRINLGPDFMHPPKDLNFKPFCDTLHTHNAELTMMDLVAKVVNGIDAAKQAGLASTVKSEGAGAGATSK